MNKPDKYGCTYAYYSSRERYYKGFVNAMSIIKEKIKNNEDIDIYIEQTLKDICGEEKYA